MISSGINFIIEYLSISENSIVLVKSKRNVTVREKVNVISDVKMKFCFFLLSLLCYCCVSCFCCVCEGAQIRLVGDSLLSIGLSSIIPFFINLIKQK